MWKVGFKILNSGIILKFFTDDKSIKMPVVVTQWKHLNEIRPMNSQYICF